MMNPVLRPRKRGRRYSSERSDCPESMTQTKPDLVHLDVEMLVITDSLRWPRFANLPAVAGHHVHAPD